MPNIRTLFLTFFMLVLLAACDLASTTPTPPPSSPSPQAQATNTSAQPTAQPTNQQSNLPSKPVAALFAPNLTTEPLNVVATFPADKSDDAPVTKERARLIVQFNHPVVPLVSVEAQKSLPQPLTLQPDVKGAGEWLNTSTYVFTPNENLRVAMTYTVKIASVVDMLGQKLDGFGWSFKTSAPAIAQKYPDENTQFVGVTQPLSVTFNTEMDKASVESRFTLKRGDGSATTALTSGRFEWDGLVMRFKPNASLTYDTKYTAQLAAGAQDVSRVASSKTTQWSFTTVKEPAIVSTLPKDGDKSSKDIRSGFVINFSAPMDDKNFKYTMVPTITNPSVRFESRGKEAENIIARIYGGWLASQEYVVTISGDSLTRYGEKLGKDVVVRFTAAALDPVLSLSVPGMMGMYDANGPQLIYATHTNIDRIDYELFRVDRNDFMQLIGRNRFQLWNNYRPPSANKLREWSQTPDAPLNASRIISTTLAPDATGRPQGAPLPPGVYYLAATTPPTKNIARQLLVVSGLNLALKRTDKEALVWVTDLKLGQPVPDVPIALYASPSSRGAGANDAPLLASGKTDKDGLFRATFTGVEAFDPIFALSELSGRVIGAVGSDWNSGVAIWDFNLPGQYQAQDYYANLYTDRSIYRPGQTVYFKGIVRRDDDANYTLPDVSVVPVKVRDAQGKEIFKQDVTLNRFGTFNGEIKLSEAAATGTYDLNIELGTGNRRTVSNVSFVVAEYRRPEFQVETQSDKNAYTNGETIKVETNASYFFGGAVNDAEVKWRLLSEDLFFRVDADKLPAAFKGWWDFVDEDVVRDWQRRGEVTREGKGQTDAKGNFAFAVPADLKDFPLSQTFTLEAEVLDINHQSVANRVSVPVHKGSYYIGVRPQRYVGTAGKEQAAEVMTVDSRSVVTAPQSVTVSFYERKWFSVREKREDGNFYWKSTYTDTLVSKVDVTTNASAPVVAYFTPSKGGLYRIVAEGTDASNNPLRSATYLWVAGSEFINWRIENNDRIDLVADKQTYNVGDTAVLLIASPFKDAEALLTIERGSIREVRRVRIASTSDRIQIPIKSDYAPNVFVSVMLVKGRGPDSPLPQFKLGYASLAVSLNEKELQVKVTTDKQKYSPDEKATFTIEAKDAAGKPVEAEFSVALVDKAVQSLVDDLSTSLREAFYGRRGLRVQTAATLVNFIERANQTTQAEAKGGGGGVAEQPGVRRNFRDTAWWNASVTTDANGRAQVTIPLPDNLTTWNFAAKGVTAATLVGDARMDIISTKDLLVRPVTPRFFVVGDKVQLEAVVNNNGDKDVRANVSIETRELNFDNSAQRLQMITVKAHDKAKVSWLASVPSGATKAIIKFAVSGGEGLALQDAIELTIPVKQYSTAETVATAGQVDTHSAEKIQLPAIADKNAGELTIELAPSLAAANNASLKYLDSFAYECTEQTVSKFFPNVAVYLALQRLGLDRPAIRLGLEVNVSREVQRLYALQNVDSGWGWCARDESQPNLTAYALLSLHTARTAGFAVNQDVMNRAEQYLNRYLDKPVDVKLGYAYNERAFVIFVLAELGRNVTSRAVNLYEARANLGQYGKAYLLMALKRANLTTQALAVQTELTSAAKQSATGTHWEEAQTDYYLMNTNTRTTALVVLALARTLDPKVLTLTDAVRWLMAARKDGHWQTTQETAWATLALTEYMAASGELQGNYTFNVSLNGKPLGDGTVNKTNVDQAKTLTVAVQELALSAANDLLIERNGTDGRLYYAASLRYYVPADQVKALNRGIIVGRQYFAVDPQTLQPTDRAIETAKVGDYVQVKLVVVAPTELHYLALEDPLPAGFEAVNTTLKTSSVAVRAPELKDKSLPEADSLFGRWYRPWWSYWAYSDLRDDRVAVFATFLGKGTYEYTYMLRASVAGEFRAAPVVAYEMYFPDVMGRSGGTVFSVMGN